MGLLNATNGLALRALLMACAFALTPHLDGADAVSKEYQIKAAFLFNFVKFVEWPEAAFPAPETPIGIGVLGDDPLGSALDEIVRGEIVHERKIEVIRSQRIEDLRTCHLIFISRSEKNRLKDILASLDRVPILTVSDLDDFVTSGGVIHFYLDANKVRFEINPSLAKRLNLKVSAQLLNLGKIVEREP